jgi:hypothetical protein
MLIYIGCRLRAKMTIRTDEIRCTDAVVAEGTRKGNVASHWFYCVVSHDFIVASDFVRSRRHELLPLTLVPLHFRVGRISHVSSVRHRRILLF